MIYLINYNIYSYNVTDQYVLYTSRPITGNDLTFTSNAAESLKIGCENLFGEALSIEDQETSQKKSTTSNSATSTYTHKIRKNSAVIERQLTEYSGDMVYTLGIWEPRMPWRPCDPMN